MLQKLSLSCALVTGPELLLLDEPSVGMDLEASSDLVERLKWLTDDQQCTVVITSHQMDFMEELCDEVAFISDGRIILRGSIDEVRWLFRQKYYRFVLRREDCSGCSVDLSRFPGMISSREDLPDHMIELLIDATSAKPETLVMLASEGSLEVVRLELVQPSLKECYQMLFSRRHVK